MPIAIIGAGMAGLSCAQALGAEAKQVRVFDKGRGPGGRMSTRRAETPLGMVRWDHGAQFFTARSEVFAEVAEQWMQAGAAQEWTGRFITIDPGGDVSETSERRRFVGAPGMNGVVRHMARGVSIDWDRRVTTINGRPGDWSLAFEDGRSEGPFSAVVVATPPEQAVSLLAPASPDLSREAAEAVSEPCWALMLAFEDWRPDFAGAEIESGPLSWIADNASKPGRARVPSIVAHASPDWSRVHLEIEADAAAEKLAQGFRIYCPDAPEPVFAATHRWRYARISRPALSASGWDGKARIGTCGDWRIGPRVEAAWTSGLLLAQKIIAA